MAKSSDIAVRGVRVYFLPVTTRVPLKFGTETLTSVTCVRVALRVEDRLGRSAEGWGETPLSVQWVWPSSLPYAARHEALKAFCLVLGERWADWSSRGHPMEVGHAFQQYGLKDAWQTFNLERPGREMPWLAALVCCSAFDIALHDAYGRLHGLPTYETYTGEWMNLDLSTYLRGAAGREGLFRGRYPTDFLRYPRPDTLPVWHLVGGLDWLDPADDDGSGPDDGYPVVLRDWIRRDGLKCLKVKLRGNDATWDYDRLVRVGRIALEEGVLWLSADFNCTVQDPAYVTEILDRLLWNEPRIYGMLLYVEQPFPYELEEYPLDVRSVSARKPLFMDESAHDWTLVAMGHGLGWTGVALKTCKTQTGALLSLCWARAHGMTLMVQDLTNPMLAQVPHVLLAAHANTIMGVESNGMQFYPEASRPEMDHIPGLYQRRHGVLRLADLRGSGLSYSGLESVRSLPDPVGTW
ncbi:MAG TPA: hypothetical protein PK349_06170 [Candidatus Hydrogenedentes bacterium]|nr:hypothetical protein [Candidatus Hydrogenedentota bacterium]